MPRLIFTALLFAASLPAFATEEVFNAPQGGVDVSLFIPAKTKVLRGVLLHVANYKLEADDRWAELCRSMNYAHMALSMNMKENNRPTKMRKALNAALKPLAEASSHPELPNLPYMGIGHSAGGMVIQVLSPTPERVVTHCVSCSWIADPAKLGADAAAAPHLFTLGAIPDAFKMLPDIESHFLPARKAGLPWGLAVQWECAHDFGQSATLFVPWMQAIAAARGPADWNPLTGPATLSSVKQESGWLGDRTTTSGNFAVIAPFNEFKGDKGDASWLPDQATACLWRAVMSKDAPVSLEAATSDGKEMLKAFDPKSERGMMIEPGAELVLSANVSDRISIKKIAFYEGATLLGESAQAPWQLTWKNIPQGAHAIYAQWTTTNDTLGVTTPALIVMKGK